MNELFDKLILRIIFTIFICITVLLYKYAHIFLYPSSKHQLFKRFYPSKNSADTLHLFGRLIGIGLLYSEFYFYLSEGFGYALFDFFFQAVFIGFLYLVSIYIIESISLYNFEYSDEILKRKNHSYALVSFSHSISLAYVLKIILFVSHDSLVMLFFLWLFSMVILGFVTKTFPLLSKLQFNRLIVQKNMSLALSYLGFTWGWTIILASSLNRPIKDIKWYGISVLLNIVLAIIVLPIFKKGLSIIFNIQDDIAFGQKNENSLDSLQGDYGYGLYEGAMFFTSCFLTIVTTGNIRFGDFYPTL